MVKKTAWLIGGLSTALVGATASAIAIPIVIKNKAKDALSNFIDLDGGKPPVIDSEKRLNIVALGVSITAGYNTLSGKDIFSFADVLARDLKNDVPKQDCSTESKNEDRRHLPSFKFVNS